MPAYNTKTKEHETEKRGRKKKIRKKKFLPRPTHLVVLGFMIWCAMEGFAADVFFTMCPSVYFWWFSASLRIIWNRSCAAKMDDLTEAQKAAYKRFVLLDVIGYVGLVFFMISLNTFGIRTFG